MSINTIIQVLVELIIGLMLSIAVMITRQRQGLMLAMPNGAMPPGDLWELKRLGLQLLNVSKGGVTNV